MSQLLSGSISAEAVDSLREESDQEKLGTMFAPVS